MPYSELIKDFGRIRDYMRQFYVYGFKSREEYDAKSARSYDNERRRIESWLGKYMSFRRSAQGKSVFLSMDSRTIPHNPLYKAFKAKSFTDKDITLHFYILDILRGGKALCVGEILSRMEGEYLCRFEAEFSLDESTLRKKLKEYCAIGLLASEKRGRETVYALSEDAVNLESWQDAVSFFSEISPLGVVGSYLLDKYESAPGRFSFKHHYLLHVLDSEVLRGLFEAMGDKRCAEIQLIGLRTGRERTCTVYPMKIYISSQGGREYLLCYLYKFRKPTFFRLDSIVKVTPGAAEEHFADYDGYYEKFAENLWGVSTGAEHFLDHVEMTIRMEDGEEFILQRLEREKRAGRVEALDAHTAKFTADVYDADELIPWMRTFIGRIIRLDCSDPHVVRKFYEDLGEMAKLYGGESHAVP